jgi:hypothetical protein
VFTVVIWLLPDASTIAEAAPAVLVKLKFTDPTFAADAVKVKLPALPFAVNVGAVAIPDALLVTVDDPLNDPLDPFIGAANVTETPETGLPKLSLNLT